MVQNKISKTSISLNKSEGTLHSGNKTNPRNKNCWKIMVWLTKINLLDCTNDHKLFWPCCLLVGLQELKIIPFCWNIRINPATMGCISVVISPVKVNRAEEVIGNPEYILLWFWRNQKSRIGIGSSYPMTYSGDGTYVPNEHGQVTGQYRLWPWL